MKVVQNTGSVEGADEICGGRAFLNRLPPGELLVVLPPQATKQQQTLKTVAQLWRRKRHHVTVVVAQSLRKDGER